MSHWYALPYVVLLGLVGCSSDGNGPQDEGAQPGAGGAGGAGANAGGAGADRPVIPPPIESCVDPSDCNSKQYSFTAAPAQPSPAQGLLPAVPAFPPFTERCPVIAEGRKISSSLEDYIKRWLDGKAAPEIPPELIPKGTETQVLKSFRLVKPSDVTPEQQWGIRAAESIDFAALRAYFPDPNVTYLVQPSLLAPIGSKVIFEGDFPHARFFDIQVTPSLHPEAVRSGAFGVGEVPIVDADIEPLPGHTNPFRLGADRSAVKRSYKVIYEMAVGNPVTLNPGAFEPPFYRAKGNFRCGGAIQYQGALGRAGAAPPISHDRGEWDVGQVWLRYYAPDKAAGKLGGVPLPKITYQLPDGRQYYILADFSAFVERSNKLTPAIPSAPMFGESSDKSVGWGKGMGITRAVYSGIAKGMSWLVAKDYVRALDKATAMRGEDMPPPGNYEPSATSCTYINYLLRGFSKGPGKIVVLTGKLPTTPKTRQSQKVFTGAEARYWSLTGYTTFMVGADGAVGAALQSVMDDEVVTDDQQRYVIAMSAPEDRPTNATELAGVTWINWGPVGDVNWTIRWLSVNPEWHFSGAPSENRLGWNAEYTSKSYDESLLGFNKSTGALGEYQPIVRYLTRAEFEALGSVVTATGVPEWK